MTVDSAMFQTTRWTLLDRASKPEGGEALDELCQRYWGPVYSFLRWLGCREADAQDLTQDFFVGFMKREGFAKAEKDKGRFRSFLLGAVRNHFLNARKAESRIKRGGGMEFMEVNDDREYLELAVIGLSPAGDGNGGDYWRHEWQRLPGLCQWSWLDQR